MALTLYCPYSVVNNVLTLCIMNSEIYPYASLNSDMIQRPVAKETKRRAVTIVPVELAIDRGFKTKPRARWNINGNIVVFGRSFALFFTAAWVYFL